MTTEEKLLAGARKLLTTCMNVQKGEQVLIVTDPEMSFRIAQALFKAAQELEADPSVLYIAPAQNPGDDPNRLAQTVMGNADVILTPTSRTLFHCPSIKAAVSKGARLGTLSEADEQLLMEGAIEADFLALQPKVHKVCERFTKGKTLHFKTPAGTDLTASIESRAGIANDSIVHKAATAQGVPDLEVYIAPVEGTANGTIVIDASSSTIGLIEDAPIVITIENGMATRIEGGKEARQLKATLEKPGDANCFNLAEMAVGMNPNAKLRGNIIEDESIYGTCHCALGTNANFGGVVKAPIHIDMVQWKPTVTIDGEMIFKDGEMLI